MTLIDSDIYCVRPFKLSYEIDDCVLWSLPFDFKDSQTFKWCHWTQILILAGCTI